MLLPEDWSDSLRPMGRTDLGQVSDLESQVSPMPWALGAFSDCLGAGYDNWVIEIAGQVNAFLVMAVSAGEAHLLNFAVQPAHQRQGMGSWLLHQAQQYAAQRGAVQILLEVRPSNGPALGLYTCAGFEVLSRRRNYYRGKAPEDALVMCCGLSVGAEDAMRDPLW